MLYLHIIIHLKLFKFCHFFMLPMSCIASLLGSLYTFLLFIIYSFLYVCFLPFFILASALMTVKSFALGKAYSLKTGWVLNHIEKLNIFCMLILYQLFYDFQIFSVNWIIHLKIWMDKLIYMYHIFQ